MWQGHAVSWQQKSDKSAILLRFGSRLKEWRESQHRKMSDVAAEFGVATSSWGHWEEAVCLPSGENLLLLVEFTKIPLQHFVCPNSDHCPFARGAA